MRKLSPRGLRVTAVTAAAAFAVLPMAAASAATVNASAYGADVKALNLVEVGPLAVSTYPGPDATVVPLHVTGLADVLGVYSTTSGDPTTGTSSATAGTADVKLLGTALTGYGITANAVSATCTAVGTDVSGSTTVANLVIGGQPALNLTAVQQQNVITIPNLASVIIGEQIINPDGSLTVNALHVTALNGTGADIVLGSVTCGPNVAVAGAPAFSFQDMPLILGGLALLIAAGFGVRAGARRLRSIA